MLPGRFLKEKVRLGEKIIATLKSEGAEEAFSYAEFFLSHSRKELSSPTLPGKKYRNITTGMGAALYAMPALFEANFYFGDKLLRKVFGFSGIDFSYANYAGGKCRHKKGAFLLVSAEKNGSTLIYAFKGLQNSRDISFLISEDGKYTKLKESSLLPTNIDPFFHKITETFVFCAKELMQPSLRQRIANLFYGIKAPFFDEDIIGRLVMIQNGLTKLSPLSFELLPLNPSKPVVLEKDFKASFEQPFV